MVKNHLTLLSLLYMISPEIFSGKRHEGNLVCTLNTNAYLRITRCNCLILRVFLLELAKPSPRIVLNNNKLLANLPNKRIRGSFPWTFKSFTEVVGFHCARRVCAARTIYSLYNCLRDEINDKSAKNPCLGKNPQKRYSIVQQYNSPIFPSPISPYPNPSPSIVLSPITLSRLLVRFNITARSNKAAFPRERYRESTSLPMSISVLISAPLLHK